MIWVGTSGFQYPEWKGSFYPSDLPVSKMLPYYAEQFSTTEINYSFYRIPSEKTLAAWSAATPVRFQFSLKAPKEITHVRKLRDCAEVVGRFFDAAAKLQGKLGIILFQLPPFFKRDLPLLKNFVGGLPPNARCAMEFRHPSWFEDDVYAVLKTAKIALCVAESGDLATPVVFTADFGYLRLRREDYVRGDLARWAETIAGRRSQLREIYVYLKHEEKGLGPAFARGLMGMVQG